MIQTANAPVSYGVFDLARPDLVPLPDGERLLELVGEAGYDGVDLGPHGYFGKGQALVENLAANGLTLCGGWIDLPFTGDDEAFEAAYTSMLPVLDDFALAAAQQAGTGPKPTIADSGSPERKAHPGGGVELELDAEAWRVFVARIDRVQQEVQRRGLEPTFHHHAATHIETPREIERFLADTRMDLTLDSGHLLIGGGDPLTGLREWRSRINHIHLKDANVSVLAQAAGSANLVRDLWEKRMFVPLGDGDLDIGAFMGELVGSGYDQWLVVEQDVVLLNASDVQRAIDDQVANRVALREWLA